MCDAIVVDEPNCSENIYAVHAKEIRTSFLT